MIYCCTYLKMARIPRTGYFPMFIVLIRIPVNNITFFLIYIQWFLKALPTCRSFYFGIDLHSSSPVEASSPFLPSRSLIPFFFLLSSHVICIFLSSVTNPHNHCLFSFMVSVDIPCSILTSKTCSYEPQMKGNLQHLSLWLWQSHSVLSFLYQHFAMVVWTKEQETYIILY